MIKRLLVVPIVTVMLAGCGGGGSGAGGVVPQSSGSGPIATSSGPLPEPPTVLPVHGVATVSLTAQIDAATGFPQFVYRGQKGVMPTIRVNPGDTIVVDVANNLPSAGGRNSDMNLHFHGLTVSPKPPADDVITTLSMPGGTLHYVVPIPKNQEPGLYWYHPHVFPVVDYQVGQAGMSGAIVINGLEKHLPGLATMKERLIIVRDTDVSVAQQNVVRPNDVDSNGNPCGPDPGLQPTLNGAVRPTIDIQPGERQFFRVINATGHKNLKLAYDGGSLEVVAIDGYALDVNQSTPPTETLSSIVVPPAARVEFVVTGPASGTSEFRTLCYNSGPTGDPDPMNVLADLRAKGSSGQAMHVAQRALPLRVGAPLPHNAFSGPMPAPAVKRTVVLNEDSNGMYINGKQFNMNDPPMFTVHVGTTEQWNVVNITEEVHDFHMHQVHFLVQQINGTTVQHPIWADSAVVPHRIPGANGSWKPGYLTVLVDFRDPVIAGMFMFHCHILDHEDSGMMAKIDAI
jgi:suppressor of ftsI